MANNLRQLALQNLIKELRLNSNLKQSDLAQKLKKPQSYISKYESGEKLLYFTELYEICHALDVSLFDFIKQYENHLNQIQGKKNHE